MPPLRETVSLPGGAQATYEVIGNGEPLFYFQGGPGDSASLLRDDAELLADRFAVYLIDPPGTGGSTPAHDPSDYDQQRTTRIHENARRPLAVASATSKGSTVDATVALTQAAPTTMSPTSSL